MPATNYPPRSAAASGLYYVRLRRGLSRGDVAEAMIQQGHDWTEETVKNIEVDRRRLSPREDRDLRRTLGVADEDFLIDGIDLTEGAVTERYLQSTVSDLPLAAAA